MKDFQATAKAMITAMETHARSLGVKGAIVVASMDETGFSWTSEMKAVNAITAIDDRPEREVPGYNFIGIAYTKAAEMASTKINSGSNIRPAYKGEYGYRGGIIKKIQTGYIIAVFSGATSEQDLEIAQAGIKALVE